MYARRRKPALIGQSSTSTCEKCRRKVIPVQWSLRKTKIKIVIFRSEFLKFLENAGFSGFGANLGSAYQAPGAKPRLVTLLRVRKRTLDAGVSSSSTQNSSETVPKPLQTIANSPGNRQEPFRGSNAIRSSEQQIQHFVQGFWLGSWSRDHFLSDIFDFGARIHIDRCF